MAGLSKVTLGIHSQILVREPSETPGEWIPVGSGNGAKLNGSVNTVAYRPQGKDEPEYHPGSKDGGFTHEIILKEDDPVVPLVLFGSHLDILIRPFGKETSALNKVILCGLCQSNEEDYPNSDDWVKINFNVQGVFQYGNG